MLTVNSFPERVEDRAERNFEYASPSDTTWQYHQSFLAPLEYFTYFFPISQEAYKTDDLDHRQGMHRLFVSHSSRERDLVSQSPSQWEATGMLLTLELQPIGKTMQCLIDFASHQLALALLFSTDSFVVLIHHGKGRSHEITGFKLAYTVRVIAPKGMNSDHL